MCKATYQNRLELLLQSDHFSLSKSPPATKLRNYKLAYSHSVFVSTISTAPASLAILRIADYYALSNLQHAQNHWI